MDIFKQLEEHVIRLFDEAKGSHDWEHTKRVYNMCLHLGKAEKADMEIVRLAALLHDIGRSEQDKNHGKISHEKLGATMAEEILASYGVSEEIIEKVKHCILTHRFREKTHPTTIEAKVLFDADKLDAIGAIGIGRAFVFAGEVGAVVHNKDIEVEKTKSYSKDDSAYREFLVKLVHVKDRLYTDEGKKLAEDRHNYMVSFFERINLEVDGII
ncbi:MAG: HD domain-containing protein [Clostridia bacterium]|nr:HD domain-containing protein [Clostridia bacterium]